MRLSVVYMTGRAEPRLDWFLAGIATQSVPSDDVQLVVVDTRGRPLRELGNPTAGDKGVTVPSAVSDVVVTKPKPNVWQGEHRLTSRDWWATANARNTGAVYADAPYVAFVDDRCSLGPHWLSTVRDADRERSSVVAGSYDKHEDGRVTQDHRRELYPFGKPDCGGGWLYGCSFSLPLAWYLDVNGQEEGCDGLSGEDYVMGLMLANAGHRVDFRPRMLVVQDRSRTSSHAFARTDKGTSPRDKSHAALERFGKLRRTEFTPDLVAVRRSLADGLGFPAVDPEVPHLDWFDGQPISEMEPPP